MAKDILKEAIADAKAVREVALANAKAALEEAFTPKLQSMLSAKLSEELNEEDEEDLEENKEEIEENYMEETNETYMEEETNLDEEIDLEEILNELELEEAEDSEEKPVDEAKGEQQEAKHDKEEEDLEEDMKPNYKAEYVKDVSTSADKVYEGKEFDLDSLLEEINNLDEYFEDRNVGHGPGDQDEGVEEGIGGSILDAIKIIANSNNFTGNAQQTAEKMADMDEKQAIDYLQTLFTAKASGRDHKIPSYMPSEKDLTKELANTQAALEVKTTELNEVNLLNSKLLYVNRIFKANTLDDSQKLRVVESLDKAECIKEAKLIYETIKDTFTISKRNITNPKRSIREGLGMASKPSGTTQSVARNKAVLNESNDMVARFKKLANITINQ